MVPGERPLVAQLPTFVFSPSTLFSAIGLQSVLRQTLRPRHIVLVGDGSSDATAARAQAFCDFHGAETVTVRRATSIGKTPAIKQSFAVHEFVEAARRSDSGGRQCG